MLEGIRRNAQSWGVKALFAIIVLVFVFWGVGGFRGNQKAVLAIVDDMEISTKEFYRYYEDRRQALQQQRPNLTSQDLEEMNFKQRVFEHLVENKILQKKASQLGLVVTSKEIKEMVDGMEAFKDEKSRFDPDRYKQILRANRMTPGQFEMRLRDDIRIHKFKEFVQLPAKVSQEEAKDFYSYVQEQAKIEYLTFAWQDYKDKVELGEKEIEKHYQDHQDQFKQQARMKMEYLLLNAETLAKSQEVSQQEIKEYYQRNKDNYSREEQVKAKHILIELDQQASKDEVSKARQTIEDIRNQLEKGAGFGELAKKFSQGPSAKKGGDLGWFSRGRMVESFEKTAFDLQPGEISQPVRTPFGLHLIKVEDKKPAGHKSLQEVQETIKNRIAKDKAMDKLEDKLDVALDTLLSTGSLSKAAQAVDLDLRQSDWFTKAKGPAEINLNQEETATLFDLKKGEMTDTPILLEDGYLLAKKIEFDPEHIKPLSKVKSTIEKKLKRQKAMDLAKEAAQTELKELTSKKGSSLSPKKESQVSKPFNRRGFIPGLGYQAELAQDALAEEEGKWLPKTYKTQFGYVLARLKEKMPISQEKWEGEKDIWISRLNNFRKQELFQAFSQGLRQEAKVQIKSPEILKN